MTGRIQLPVCGVLCLVPHDDVRRISDDDVIALAEDRCRASRIFDSIDRVHLKQITLLENRNSLTLFNAGLLPNKRLSPVARLIFHAELACSRLIPQALTAATSKRNRVIATANGLMSTPQTPSSAFWAATTDFVDSPSGFIHKEKPGKCPKQEMPGTAGRIDEANLLQPELVQGRRQSPVEDELLDEHRGL